MRQVTRAVVCALGLLAVAAQVQAQAWPLINDRLEIRYTLEIDGGGEWQSVAVTQGFESGDRFKLRVRPAHDAFFYLFVSAADGGFTLAAPGPGGGRSAPVAEDTDARLPGEEESLRLDEEPGFERLYLLASTRRVSEVEALREDAGPGERAQVSEEWLIDLRDEHARNGTLTRQVRNQAVRLDYRQRGRGPAVVFETIAIRHFRGD